MKGFFLLLIVSAIGTGSLGVTVNTPFALGRPAGDWNLFGVALALPNSLANPAALGLRSDGTIVSTFSSLYGLVQIWAVALAAPGWGGEALLIDSPGIGPGVDYRVWAVHVSGSLGFGSLAVGGRARVLHPVRPQALLGGALDLGLLWLGPVSFGLLAEAMLALSPYAQEPWPLDFSLAVALRGDLRSGSGWMGFALVDLLTDPTGSLAGAVELGPLSLRLGFQAANLSLGGGVRFPAFAVDWVFTLHPDLPWSFRVSFSLRWSREGS